MADDEQQKEPRWKPGDLEALQSATIVLETAKPVAEGEHKSYGNWWLWPVQVENAKVYDRENNAEIQNYTGKAVCFPSEKLHESFLKHTNGTKENVKIKVTMVPKKNKRGNLYTTYETQLVEDGTTPPSNLLNSQNKFLGDFKKFVENKVIQGTKEDFYNFGRTDIYQLPDETLEKLWKVYQEG